MFDWETDKDYQQMNIRFDVDSGPRARFTTPVLVGDLKMDQQTICRRTKFRRWLIHTWKPMTQTRVRQGLDGVRSLYQKENRLEAKVAARIDEVRRRDQQRHPDAPASTPVRASRFGPSAPSSPRRRCSATFRFSRSTRWITTCWSEGARNLRDYFQSQGYFEAEVEFKEQRVINDRATIDYLINTGTRHKLVYDRDRPETTISIRETLRERMYLQTGLAAAVPARALQREPAAPRRGLHPQPLPVERFPRT